MAKPHMSSGATKLLLVLKQLQIDGRQYRVTWNDTESAQIPPNAPVARFQSVPIELLKAELLAFPSANPDADVMTLHNSIEGWLSELCALGLIRTLSMRSGLGTALIYSRPDGKIVSFSLDMVTVEWSAAGKRKAPFVNVSVDGVIVGGHPIERALSMYELTPEGARIALAPRRTRKQSSARRARRTEPTMRELQALELRSRRYTFEQIGDELGVTKQAAHALVNRGMSRRASTGRSVRTTRLPTDHRGQEITPSKSGEQPSGD